MVQIHFLEDIHHSKLVPYQHLRTRKRERRTEEFVAEGRWLVERLIRSRSEVLSVLTDGQHLDEVVGWLDASQRKSNQVEVLVLAESKISDLIGFKFHRGMMAVGRLWQSADLGHWTIDRMVVCNGVADPQNLGAIMRAAAAFGIDTVAFDDRCGNYLSRQALRVSMGAPFHLRLIQGTDMVIEELIDRHQLPILLTSLDSSAVPLPTYCPPQRFALILGSEGFGVTEHWMQSASTKLTLPMAEDCDSLNVAVACGIFLYHLTLPQERA